jgi:hypothetical protein
VNLDQESSQPLFSQSQGPATRQWELDRTFHTGPGSVRCEGCGRNLIGSIQNPLSTSKVLGHRIIDQCCGAFLDRLYEELSIHFFPRLVNDFAQAPLDNHNYLFRYNLTFAVAQWRKALRKSKSQYEQAKIRRTRLTSRKTAARTPTSTHNPKRRRPANQKRRAGALTPGKGIQYYPCSHRQED